MTGIIFYVQIISNTTISRPEPVDKHPLAAEPGGLSGKPLFDLSTNILKEMYILTRVFCYFSLNLTAYGSSLIVL